MIRLPYLWEEMLKLRRAIFLAARPELVVRWQDYNGDRMRVKVGVRGYTEW